MSYLNVRRKNKEKKAWQPRHRPADIGSFPRHREPAKQTVTASPRNSYQSPKVSARLESQLLALQGGGSPLSSTERSFFEPPFGRRFDKIRIHTGVQPSIINRRLNAQAFTLGRNIYFGENRYQPNSAEGRRLLAHELVHTIQQSPEADSAVPEQEPHPSSSRSDDSLELTTRADTDRFTVIESPALPLVNVATAGPANIIARGGDGESEAAESGVVQEAVDTIIEALEGYTSRWDSENILAQFPAGNAPRAGSIMQALKGRASQHGLTAAGMVSWLFGDMTAEDRRTLRQRLIRMGIVDDMARIVAGEIKDLLEGYTSESDSGEIDGLVGQFSGTSLDEVLTQLESQTGNGSPAMAEWLFGDLYRLNAERIRRHFLASGGTHANQYAIRWTASKIEALIAGYTSHSDSSAIRWNFENTPAEYLPLVQTDLNQRTTARWEKPLEDALMEDMDQSDYERVRRLPGMTLRAYDHEPSGLEHLETVASVLEWGLVVAEWLVCGVAGIVTGALAVIGDLVKLIVVDLPIAVYDLLMSLVYLLSGGAAGSSNWLAVKEFFIGIGRLFSDPGEIFDQLWNEMVLDFETIEGPLTDCRQAEFLVRKFVYFIINIVLIFVGGYGLAKGGVSLVKGAATFGTLVREVGLAQALAQTGARLRGAIVQFSAISAAQARRLLAALRQPMETLSAIRRQLNVIFLTAENEGYWAAMRGRFAALAENERRFWRENRRFWRERAEAKRMRQAALEDDARVLNDGLQNDQAPPAPDEALTNFEDDVNNLSREVDDLQRDVTGEIREPAARPPPASSLPRPGTILARGRSQPQVWDAYTAAARRGAPEGIEVGVYRRRLPNGEYEYAVVQGSRGAVSAPAGDEGWVNVSHYHPGALQEPGFRNPAPQDLDAALRDWMRRPAGEQGPLVQTVHADTPGGLRGVDFGIDESVRNRPYFVRLPGQAEPLRFRSLWPDHMRSALYEVQGDLEATLRLFRQLDPAEYYAGWWARQFGPIDGGHVPPGSIPTAVGASAAENARETAAGAEEGE